MSRGIDLAQRYQFRLIFTGLLISLAAGSADAGIPVDNEYICPIGGEKFVQTGTMSCTTFGMRFDLKRISSCQWVKWPVICPTNGFPIYKLDFSSDEVKRLSAIVKAENFQKNRIGNVPSFSLYLVKKAMGEDDAALADALLPAIWDAAPGASRQLSAYLDLAVNHNKRALSAMRGRDRHWWKRQILTANLERRLSRFEAAAKRLAALPDEQLAPDEHLHRVIKALREYVRNRNAQPQRVP